MFAVVDGVVGCGWCEEIGWNDFCALVDELIEGVLAVGSSCSPEDGLDVMLVSLW